MPVGTRGAGGPGGLCWAPMGVQDTPGCAPAAIPEVEPPSSDTRMGPQGRGGPGPVLVPVPTIPSSSGLEGQNQSQVQDQDWGPFSSLFQG